MSGLKVAQQNSSQIDQQDHLENCLIFGSMPEVTAITDRDAKINYLAHIITPQGLKDRVGQAIVREPQVLANLLQLLAFFIGREISAGELASRLGVDGKTANRYLELLIKSGIILQLNGLRRNLQSEISRKSRYYFVDNGVRNAVLSQFNELKLRSDAEQLWENFVIVERMKKLASKGIGADSYFWHTYAGQELKLVEEHDGTLSGYGFKLSHHKTPRTPKAWFGAYPEAHYSVINLNNYLEFIS